MNIVKFAASLGERVHRGRTILPELALAVVREAAAGDVKPTDAESIYKAYISAACGGDFTKRMTYGSYRAQCSKLRQVIRLGLHWGRHGATVMRWAANYHMTLSRPTDLYGAMVDIARAQLRSDKKLTRVDVWRFIK
jgi:hypothetical protein